MSLKYSLFLTAFMISTAVFAQETIRMNAIKANNYGVVYSLPKTSFVLSLKVKKTTYKRGEFYQYAQRYLGINNPITENRTVYSLEDVSVLNKGIPDKENSFMIEFRPNTLEPYVFLTKDGLICSVNTQPEMEPTVATEKPTRSEPPVNSRRFLSEETLMAGSSAKQAELVSKQILDLRRSRNDILVGEAENMPPDGEAYKLVMQQIDTQEKALTEMFSGSTETETYFTTVTVVPDGSNIDRKIVARFSEKLGPVDPDDLAGAPVYFTLTSTTPQPEMQLSDKDLQRLENKLKTGLVYNVPGKAALKIEYNNRILKNMETDVVQYGSQDVLTKAMFNNLKQPIKVIFYPELGAIKQIIQ